MAEASRQQSHAPVLAIDDLRVDYGHVPALQGVSLTLDRGVLAVVGRNGMGKTTTCNAILGLVRAKSGSIRFDGRELIGRAPNEIAHLGVGYVPQGRRVWPSLTVDEHLRLAARGGPDPSWSLDRVYRSFPRLAERKRHGGGQLSGGEQQMLAIARALLSNPTLLVMDEPTEGLAPVIVEQVEQMLRELVDDDEISVLLIEQNIGVALRVAERVAVMVNGAIARDMAAHELANDLDLQQRLVGVGRHDEEVLEDNEVLHPAESSTPEPATVFRVRRAGGDTAAVSPPRGTYHATPPTRWSQANPRAENVPGPPPSPLPTGRAEQVPAHDEPAQPERVAVREFRLSVADAVSRAAYVAGTFDTKARELLYLKTCLRDRGLRVVTVDLSTSGRPSPADVGPKEVAHYHPQGANAVFTNDRGSAVAAMAEAFARFLPTRRDIGGVISAGGSGGTALATPAMQRLPVGIPKVMVSTVASGDVKRYVGPTDICMMYSVTDIQGINRISERVLANAANALAGMIAQEPKSDGRPGDKPAIGLTMFGVTTPCVQSVVKALEDDYDCLVFHATGTGGESMEKLADSGMLAGIIDVTTTEIADLLMGGVFSAGEDRLGAIARTRIPYVGSCGALDMVNWGPLDTVPARFRGRNLYEHNPQVTLMRTTADENEAMGRWIAEKLNRCEGPVRFLIPEGGVSLLDAPGMPFRDEAADRALFAAIETTLRPTTSRRLIKLPHNINDPEFARALVEHFREIISAPGTASRGAAYAPLRA
jgi:uncharacterized protein (UPF0261 family)/ABC-type branched-subunit amino acid transport system ATPase component